GGLRAIKLACCCSVASRRLVVRGIGPGCCTEEEHLSFSAASSTTPSSASGVVEIDCLAGGQSRFHEKFLFSNNMHNVLNRQAIVRQELTVRIGVCSLVFAIDEPEVTVIHVIPQLVERVLELGTRNCELPKRAVRGLEFIKKSVDKQEYTRCSGGTNGSKNRRHNANRRTQDL